LEPNHQLTIVSQVFVRRVLLETEVTDGKDGKDGKGGKARAVGVEVEVAESTADGARKVPVKVRARKEVIVCAGAIGSPHLLMLR
jgi:choline dehydrogenase-like flavoprotein